MPVISIRRLYSFAIIVLTAAFSLPLSLFGQSTFDFSGLIYADYSYTLASAVDSLEGENAFGYRRVYFTANFKQSDRFSGRIRFEASDKSTTAQGKPAPFVKDLYMRWKGALGEGHDITMGVTSPPSWSVSERVWGYRSLLKALQDRGNILSSRDMGIALNGRLSSAGRVRYGVMIANNESVSRESDKHKRVYGQLEVYPSNKLSFTLGSDFASFEDGSAVNFNAFGGYSGASFRAGIEGYIGPRSFDNSPDDLIRSGISVFLVVKTSNQSSAIFRIDHLAEEFLGTRTTESSIIAGFGLRPDRGVEFIPNIIISKDSELDIATVTGRITLFMAIG